MRKRKNKKETILTAAYELFVENGYEGTAMAAISAKAGVSTAHAYLFYEDKEDLLEAAVRKSQDNNFKAYSEIISRGVGEDIDGFVDMAFSVLETVRKDALFVMHCLLTPKIAARIRKVQKEYELSIPTLFESFFVGVASEKAEVTRYLLVSVTYAYFLDGNVEEAKKAMVELLKGIKQ